MTKKQLTSIVKSFEGRKIVVFGDIMLDHFIRGKVSRISPEAPVPVVHVESENYLPGGAGNVALNLAVLGAKVQLISYIGQDEHGKRLLGFLNDRGIDTSLMVSHPKHPTIKKTRVIAEHQQVVRFDREEKNPLPAAAQVQLINNLKIATSRNNAVILSDYGKGVLIPQSIKSAISACRKNKIPVCVDPKVEHFLLYKNVTCITPNTNEAWQGMRMTPKEGREHIENLGKKILKTLSLDSVLITQGAKGMSLFEKKAPKKIHHIPTYAQEVYDVTGAGDTVISVFTLALSAKADLLSAAELGNYAAGVVVGKLGTATLTRNELLEAIKK
jgi:D-glycero-beta-D-manno-heptose-7-phosphate kinase